MWGGRGTSLGKVVPVDISEVAEASTGTFNWHPRGSWAMQSLELTGWQYDG